MAKDDNADVSTRATAAKDAVSDKAGEVKHSVCDSRLYPRGTMLTVDQDLDTFFRPRDEIDAGSKNIHTLLVILHGGRRRLIDA